MNFMDVMAASGSLTAHLHVRQSFSEGTWSREEPNAQSLERNHTT